MAISDEDVQRVADLANLELTPEERVRMQKDLGSILDYIAQMNELDTSAIPPLTQVAELTGQSARADGSSLRPDTSRPSLDREAVLAAAPETDGVFFKVPKVIER